MGDAGGAGNGEPEEWFAGAGALELLEAVQRIVTDFGGSVPLPLLAVDPQVLQIGRRCASAGAKPSLQVLLEDAARRHPEHVAGIRLQFGQAYPIVVSSNLEKAGDGEEPDEAAAAKGRGDGHGGASGSDSGTRGKRPHPLAPPSNISRSLPPRKKARASSPRGGPGRLTDEGKQVKADGVDLEIVCGDIPVVTLEKGCPFDLNASWLLQNALGSHSKADSLFKDSPWTPQKRGIIRECVKRGLAEEEAHLWVAMAVGRKDCLAVGTCGKRSVMLSLVVALALGSGDGWKSFLPELEPLKLDFAFERLIRYAKSLARRESGKE